jgi:7-cyano-7-deazaguanine synthase
LEDSVAVLVSGGLDSAVLTVYLTRHYSRVYPIYIHHGLYWEQSELDYLSAFLAAVNKPGIQPLVTLELPVRDIYGTHWSVTGKDVPDAQTPDEAVYLPGRNLLLLAKAGVWCERNAVHTIALATLAGNPFSDNTDEFYRAAENVLQLALGHQLTVIQPFREMSKEEVIRIGQELPLELTCSCIKPVNGNHCGSCNKCAERRNAFEKANVEDTTRYETVSI